VKVGDAAPRFRLQSSKGHYVALEDFLDKKNLVIYFYPKDFSVGCTKEACSFRDSYHLFQELDADIIGISPDSRSSHEAFADEERLPFLLLTDADSSVRRAYGVKSTLSLIPGRVTFVLDKQGIIQRIFSSQIRPEHHVVEALKALKALG